MDEREGDEKRKGETREGKKKRMREAKNSRERGKGRIEEVIVKGGGECIRD